MKYTLYKTGGTIVLDKSNFLASGGEGSVYVHGDQAYKIYDHPSKVMPLRKMEELMAIQALDVIKPTDIVVQNGTPVGYAMRYVERATPLGQLFTRAYRDRHRIGQDAIVQIVGKLRDGMADVHQSKVLIVDANEMNFLVSERIDAVYFIDVDSYQTKSFPATALMDSVKDWQAKGHWTELSDWYSWGIVTFQLFMGIHPYKGKHPTVHGMVDRMKAGISVFDRAVSMPTIVPGFDTIPHTYAEWYRAVFGEGKRLMPPDGQALPVQHATTRGIYSTDRLKMDRLWAFENEVVQVIVQDGKRWALLANGSVVAVTPSGINQIQIVPNAAMIMRIPQAGIAIGQYSGHQFTVSTMRGSTLEVQATFPCDQWMDYHGTAYVQVQHAIYEVVIAVFGNKTVASVKQVANVMPKATRLFPGVAVQDILGVTMVNIFPKPGHNFQARLDELHGYKVVDAKYEGGVLVVIGVKGNVYDQFVYRFDTDLRAMQVQAHLFFVERDVPFVGVNFTVMVTGLCVYLSPLDELILFSINPKHPDRKVVVDAILGSDLQLMSDEMGLMCTLDKYVYHMTMVK